MATGGLWTSISLRYTPAQAGMHGPDPDLFHSLCLLACSVGNRGSYLVVPACSDAPLPDCMPQLLPWLQWRPV